MLEEAGDPTMGHPLIYHCTIYTLLFLFMPRPGICTQQQFWVLCFFMTVYGEAALGVEMLISVLSYSLSSARWSFLSRSCLVVYH